MSEIKTTNIWQCCNVKFQWIIRHEGIPASHKKYWLNRHADNMKKAGIKKPMLRAQGKAPKPLII